MNRVTRSYNEMIEWTIEYFSDVKLNGLALRKPVPSKAQVGHWGAMDFAKHSVLGGLHIWNSNLFLLNHNS